MSNQKNSIDTLAREQLILRARQFKETAKQMGWDLKALEELGISHQKELHELQNKWSKAMHEATPSPDEALRTLIPTARQFTRSRDLVFYKPDPFGPIDVRTEGPFLDRGVPPATIPVCRVDQVTILDTSAAHSAKIDFFEGSDQIATESSDFDATAGVNHAQFTFDAAGDDVTGYHHHEFRVGFWFNFFPPENGEYVFRPTALLAASWHAGGGGTPNWGGASLRIAFRTWVYQFPVDPPTISAHHDIVLADEGFVSSALNEVIEFKTPSNGESASVSINLVRDIWARIVVSCVVRVKIVGLGSILVNASEQNFGLRVPEVHVEMLDCSGRMSLDEHILAGRERQPGTIPDLRDVRDMF
jgi:hypothetical protein